MRGRGLLSVLLLAALAPAAVSAEEVAERVYRLVHPSVVTLQNLEGSATGIIVDAQGLILTNAHVITSPLPFQTHVGSGDQTAVFKRVEIVGVHPKYDLALVRVNLAEHRTTLTPVVLAKEAGRPGQEVFAIGNPVGGEGVILTKTITSGMLSGVARVIGGLSYYQFSAQINPGNSGGPLCNREGEVLGLVTFKMGEAEGLGFAIPLDRFNAASFVPFKDRPVDPQKAKELVRQAEELDKRADTLYREHERTKAPETLFELQMTRAFVLMYYREALMESPNDPVMYYQVGFRFRQLEEPLLAAAYLVRSIELNPWCFERGSQYRELGFALLKAGKRRDAEIVWLEGLAKFPRAGRIWEDLAIEWFNDDRFLDSAFAGKVATSLGEMKTPNVKNLYQRAVNRLKPDERAALARREAGLAQDLQRREAPAREAQARQVRCLTNEFAAFMKTAGTLGLEQTAERPPDDLWKPQPPPVTPVPAGPTPPTPEPPTPQPSAPTPPKPEPPKDDADAWIASKLELARLCKQHDLMDKACNHLKEIIQRYPKHARTAEVRKLLEEWTEAEE